MMVALGALWEASMQGQRLEHGRPRVLIVDDEPHIVEFLRMGFDYEGFEVASAMDGAKALKVAQAQKPDIVILDLMLPGIPGLEVARRLRTSGDVAIIMLTARDGVDERVAGLDTGADDYLTKPFAFKELMARVRAVLRRHHKNIDRVLEFEDVRLDRDERLVTRGERVVPLTPREFELLELFLMHPRQVLTRDAILARIWGYDYEGDDNVIEVFVRHLREKLEDIPPRLIQTVRGVGYVLRI
jgi:DNA-binding response OmpR family regulator